MTPRRMLFALGALLVGINVLSAAWDIRNERALVERNALRDFNNLTALLADQTARSLESAGILVSAAANDISANGAADPATRAQRFRDRMSGIPQMRGILLLDRDGRLVVSTQEQAEIGSDYSERSYFTQQRDGNAKGRYVSEPFIGRVGHHWSFAVSEPVKDREGRFAGVVAAIIEIEYFDRLYRSLDIGELGFVALLSRDGILVTRVPPPREDLLGKRLPDRGDVLGAIASEGRYSGWASSMLAPPPAQVLISAAPVTGTSLVVAVGAPERTVLAPWRAESVRVIVRTLLTSAVMLALVWLAARELARRARADSRMQEDRRLAQLEQDRLQAKLRQAEKMEAVGRLAGGIAHDFNNDLGGIIGYGEMLLDTTAEGSTEQRYARNLLIAANRARDLVDQILAYSRSHKVARRPVDLGRVVVETLDVIQGSLPSGISLEPSIPQAPMLVLGDPTQLHQVVMNVCTNAIHAMGAAGTLSVSLEAIDLEQGRSFAHGALAPGRYVKLVVSDTGAGMDADTLARIFEPFFTTKDLGRGTGLGLSLVYGIVTDSGGAIHVSSEPGHGSSFEIHLPRADAGDVAIEETQGPIPRGQGERILLVDDEVSLLAMTAELLTRLGYEPVPFSDPRSALASLEAMPAAYDVVVTDEMMPGLTGTELARAARQARADLPIILVSGQAGPALTQPALDAGAREVLRKPVQSRELAVALARALAG